MEDGDHDVQSTLQAANELYSIAGFFPSQGANIERIGESDWQNVDSLSLNGFPPFYNQLTGPPHWEQFYWPLPTGPVVLSPWHISEPSVQVAHTPGGSDGNRGDEFGRDDQIWVNGSRPGRVPLHVDITGQEEDLPFDRGNGDIRQLEGIPGTHPNPPFERQWHPDQRVEAPESSGLQQTPDTGSAKGGSRVRLNGSKCTCDRGNCGKSYKRPQELKRHARETHEISPKCPICGRKWTRAEKIQIHLIKDHRDHFNKKERQQIRRLRGPNKTIDFLKLWEATRP